MHTEIIYYGPLRHMALATPDLGIREDQSADTLYKCFGPPTSLLAAAAVKHTFYGFIDSSAASVLFVHFVNYYDSNSYCILNHGVFLGVYLPPPRTAVWMVWCTMVGHLLSVMGMIYT